VKNVAFERVSEENKAESKNRADAKSKNTESVKIFSQFQKNDQNHR
jgi:hypothetical protein